MIELSKISEAKNSEAQAAADTQRLSHQLNAGRNKLSAEEQRQEAFRKGREEHLELVEEHIVNLEFCTATVTPQT